MMQRSPAAPRSDTSVTLSSFGFCLFLSKTSFSGGFFTCFHEMYLTQAELIRSSHAMLICGYVQDPPLAT